ncbi:hypothetical protein [Kistimonas asteriae]|uniref:hypothetical protein n=1 Tax=Kistimonas asteriae TaxID=517724 RepID=UPI001BAD50BA|nr:hypothetical protein [Kistimonas asteriae]
MRALRKIKGNPLVITAAGFHRQVPAGRAARPLVITIHQAENTHEQNEKANREKRNLRDEKGSEQTASYQKNQGAYLKMTVYPNHVRLIHVADILVLMVQGVMLRACHESQQGMEEDDSPDGKGNTDEVTGHIRPALIPQEGFQ